MFGMLAVFAEFERDIIKHRTKAGLEDARKRGRVGGRTAIDAKVKKHVKVSFLLLMIWGRIFHILVGL